jgi:hypothetical protein
MSQPTIKRILVVQWLDFPTEIQHHIMRWFGFCDKATLLARSELNLTIADYRRGKKVLEECAIQSQFPGSLESFIKTNKLEFDEFIINNFNLEEIDDILVEVHW